MHDPLRPRPAGRFHHHARHDLTMATDAQHHRNQTAIVQADRVIAQLDETIETSRRRSAEIVASLRSAVAHEHDKEAWILYTFAAIAGAALGVAMGLWL